jgi:hypothetical protein
VDGIFQKFIAEMKKEGKVAGKLSSSALKKKPVTSSPPNEKAKTKTQIGKNKEQVRDELDNWAKIKSNEPEEGWGLIEKKYKEIKLRQRYLKDKETVPWPEYLESNGLEVVKEVRVKLHDDETKLAKTVKDDSGVLGAKRRKMNEDILPAIEKAKTQGRAKDDSEKEENWLIDVYVDNKYICEMDYFGTFNEKRVLELVKKNWDVKNLDDYGNIEDFGSKISVIE